MSDSFGAAPARSGLRRRRKLLKKSEAFLPDDVVMNILSWLPAKDVLRYRCVCKVWRDLTSTRDFTDLHFGHSFPMILKEDRDGRILLDRCWEPAQTRSKIHKLYRRDDEGGVVLSQNGLIVAYDKRCSGSVFIIHNPIYPDVVNIKVHTQRPYKYKGRVCGVYFHPVQKEHCILWRKILSFNPCKFQYKILNLESDPKSREICTQNTGILSIEPVLFDKYLYWIDGRIDDDHTFSYKIMEYDIIKEEIRVIPCPVVWVNHDDDDSVNYDYDDDDRDFSLVDIDGGVAVVQVIHSDDSVEINIWTLNDDGEQSWKSCNYIVNFDVYSNYKMSKAIAFRNGELLLQANGWRYKRLYAFNLKFQTFRKFGRQYKSCVKFSPHVTSLVSLKKCKSDICMVDEDEINQPYRDGL